MIEWALGAGLLVAAGLLYRSLNEGRARARREQDIPDNPCLESPRGLRVDDVLLYGGTELWLAGCFELDEEGLVARVFRTPGNRAAPWVLQLDEEGLELALAHETDAVPEGTVPAELTVEHMRYTLRRRASVVVHRAGAELPQAPSRGEMTLLAGPGERVLLVLDFVGGPRLALRGERVPPEMLELLPAGDPEP